MSYSARETSVHSSAPRELFRFERNRECWLYTSADEPVTYNGETYDPVVIRREKIDSSEESSSAVLNIHLHHRLKLAQLMVVGSAPTPVWLTIYRGHRSDTDWIEIFFGQIAYSETEGGETKLVCQPLQATTVKPIPRQTYQRMCNHVLYDKGCGLDPANYMTLGTATGLNGLTLSVPEAGAQPSEYYTAGFLRIVGSDERVFITKHTGTSLTLLNLVPGIQAGANIEMYAGCDRKIETCRDRFNNVPNFIGFPFMPERNPFNQLDGG